MGKLLKPKKPSIKKPSRPRKPKMPKKYIGGKKLQVRDYNDYSQHSDLVFNTIGDIKSSVTMTGDLFEVQFIRGLVGNHYDERQATLKISVINVNYKDMMETYIKKMITYHEKMKEVQPKLDAYNAKIAEYEYELALYRKEEAEQTLRTAKCKLKTIEK